MISNLFSDYVDELSQAKTAVEAADFLLGKLHDAIGHGVE